MGIRNLTVYLIYQLREKRRSDLCYWIYLMGLNNAGPNLTPAPLTPAPLTPALITATLEKEQ